MPYLPTLDVILQLHDVIVSKKFNIEGDAEEGHLAQ